MAVLSYDEYIKDVGVSDTPMAKEYYERYKQNSTDGQQEVDVQQEVGVQQEVDTEDASSEKWWRDTWDKTEELGRDVLDIWGNFLGWMAKAVGWLWEFAGKALGKVFEMTTSKVWFTWPEKVSKWIWWLFEEWTETYRWILIDEDEQSWVDKIAGFGWESIVWAEVVWVASSIWWNVINGIAQNSTTLAKYLKATSPAVTASRSFLKNKVVWLPKFVAAVWLEWTIDGAIEDWEVSPSDYTYEAIANAVFGWVGDVLNLDSKNISKHINTTKIKDIYEEAVDKASSKIDDIKRDKKDAWHIVKIIPQLDWVTMDKSISVLKDQFDDIKKLWTIDEAKKALKAPVFYSNILRKQEKIGKKLWQEYKKLLETAGDSNMKWYVYSANDWIKDTISSDNIWAGELRKGSALFKSIWDNVKKIFPDVTDKEIWKLWKMLDTSYTKQEAIEKMWKFLKDKKRDIGQLFTDKKILGSSASDYFKATNTSASDKKKATLNMYFALKDKVFELSDKATKDVNFSKFDNIKNLSDKYSAYANVNNWIERELRKLLSQKEAISLSDRVTTAYLIQIAADFDDPSSFFKWWVKWAIAAGTQKTIDWFNGKNRSLKWLANKQLDSSITKWIKESFGKYIPSDEIKKWLSSDEFERFMKQRAFGLKDILE